MLSTEMGFHSLSTLCIVYSVQCAATGFPSPPIRGGAQLCQVSRSMFFFCLVVMPFGVLGNLVVWANQDSAWPGIFA